MRTQKTPRFSPIEAALMAIVVMTLAGCAQNKGACDPPCVSPLECCGGFCVNTQSDNNNCGECDNACDPGASCTLGICPAVCGDTVCTTDQLCCSDVCTDPTVDPMNCGECGTECNPGEECLDSVCVQTECDPSCNLDETCCTVPGEEEPVCADLQNDYDHCGMCNRQCTGDQVCSEGTCTLTPCEPPCGAEPNRCCGGSCYNTDTDMSHCGYCGNECDPEKADECFGGTCVCNRAGDCHSDQKCCPSIGCRNIMSDINNCGECGETCDEGYTCTDGECLCGGEVCDEGEGCCANSCRDLQSDATNCGTCDHSCGLNAPTCVDGSCLCGEDPPCATDCGYWFCDSYEVPGPYPGCQVCCPAAGGCLPMSDTNCGMCDTECTGTTMCAPVLYGMPPPFGGYCQFECVEPYPDWPIDTSTDTVTDTTSDTATDLTSDIPTED